MADAEVKTRLPQSIPVARNLTPNEMRALKVATGRPLSEILSDDPDRIDDGMQAMVWIALRRAGYEVTWDEAGDVAGDTTAIPVDPTNGATSTASSGFAAGGA